MGNPWWDDDDDDDYDYDHEEDEDPSVHWWDRPTRWEHNEDEDGSDYGFGRRNPLAGMLGPGGMPLPLIWDLWHGNWPPDGGSEVQ